MNGTGAPARAALRQGLLLSLGGLRCVLPREAVREVLPLPRLWRPPGLPRPLAGFMNLDGEALPVVDLARLFDLPEVTRPGVAETEMLYRHVLVAADGRLALLVDRVLDLVPLPPDSFRPILAEPAARPGSAAPVEPAAVPDHLALPASPAPLEYPALPDHPGPALQGCVVAQLELAGQPAGSLVPLLAWDRILLEQESAALRALALEAQRRLAEWPAAG